MTFRLVVVSVLLIFLAVFAVQNAQVVEVRLLFWTISMSRALMLLFAAALGAVVCWLVITFRKIRRPHQ